MEDDGGDTGHSINDELRMMGETGDDQDDLGMRDLFGSSPVAPIVLPAGDVRDDEGGGGAEAAAANGEPAPGASGKPPRRRASSSPVWEDFDPVYKMVGGKRVRTQGICKWCKNTLSASSSGGTGHLLRHQRDCKVKAAAQVG